MEKGKRLVHKKWYKHLIFAGGSSVQITYPQFRFHEKAFDSKDK